MRIDSATHFVEVDEADVISVFKRTKRRVRKVRAGVESFVETEIVTPAFRAARGKDGLFHIEVHGGSAGRHSTRSFTTVLQRSGFELAQIHNLFSVVNKEYSHLTEPLVLSSTQSERIVELLRQIPPRALKPRAAASPAVQNLLNLVVWARKGELAIEANLASEISYIKQRSSELLLPKSVEKVWKDILLIVK